MEPATASGERETVATRLLTSACALGVCGAFFGAQQLGALPWNGQHDATLPTLTVLGAVALVLTVGPWLPEQRRRTWFLAGSIAVGAIVVRALIVVPIAFAWLTVRVSRTNWPTWQKLCLLLGAWACVIALRSLAPRGALLPYHQLFLYWACLPTAVVCLVVERARGQLEGIRTCDEWRYLLALPRFFYPFLQPIGAARLLQSRQPYSSRLALRALGLAAYGVACLIAVQHTHYALRGSGEAFDALRTAKRVLQNGVLIYGVNASGIFCTVALFRLAGYDLGSGFRFPLLATSFSDLYRRWNYYFYEFVSTIFYLPLATALRRRVPLWLAYTLAGYVSVLLGVWAVDNLTFQLGVGGFGPSLWRELSDWQDLLVHGAIWSLILLPQVALARFRKLRQRTFWRVAAHILTLAAGAGVLLVLSWYGVTLY